MIKPHRLTRFCLLSLIAIASLAIAGQAQTGGIKGKVRANTGQSISGATVTVRKDGKDVRSATSDSKGMFSINGLESANYNVVFDAGGYSTGVLYNVEVKSGKTRDLGERLILSRDQGTQVIIKGSVFYREGTSVTGAKVDFERINADGSTTRVENALTNISGEFTFRQPEAEAKFKITARFKGAVGTKEVTVSNAAIYRLAITLDISRSEK
ncbi:MAG: carboxypeptidase regulatory-like domain-containing protein [Pyrinomonadaceae bacterium]